MRSARQYLLLGLTLAAVAGCSGASSGVYVGTGYGSYWDRDYYWRYLDRPAYVGVPVDPDLEDLPDGPDLPDAPVDFPDMPDVPDIPDF